MQKIFKKILSAMGYFLFFGCTVYILFVNLACAFSTSIHSRFDIFKVLFLSFCLAVGLPAVICLQHRKIVKLERYASLLERHSS